jgi:2'-5' RNA ligase
MEHDASWPRTGAVRHHWDWRPEWRPERPCLYWYLTFDRDALAAAVGPAVLAAVADAPWLDPVPLEWTHLTVCDLGFVDEVPAEVVARAAGELDRSLAATELPTLTLGPLVGMDSAVVLAAEPLDELRALQRRVRRAAESALGPGRLVVHRHAFWPHVSLGYVNRDVPLDEVLAVTEPFDRVRTQLPVADLVLAAVTRRRRHYQWSVRGVSKQGPARRPRRTTGGAGERRTGRGLGSPWPRSGEG